MFNEYLEPPRAERPDSPAQAVQVLVSSAGTPLSTTIDQDAPSPHISPSSSALQSHSLPPGVIAEPHFMEDHTVSFIDTNPFDHPLDNVIGNPSRPVPTRKQLATDALWCLYSSVLSKIEPKNFKSAIIEDCWFQAMQDEIHEFNQLQMQIMQAVKTQEEAHQGVLSVALRCSRCDYNSLTMALTSTRFLCIVIIIVPLLCVAIMSSTPGQSTLTFIITSFESKLREAWLNSTSCLGIKSMSPTTLKRLQEEEGE
nr:Gag-Pol polyprotein [Tanacetum cinerariifolium]